MSGSTEGEVRVTVGEALYLSTNKRKLAKDAYRSSLMIGTGIIIGIVLVVTAALAATTALAATILTFLLASAFVDLAEEFLDNLGAIPVV